MNMRRILMIAFGVGAFILWQRAKAEELLRIQNYPMSSGVVRRPNDVYL